MGSKNETALDRLERVNTPSDEREYTLEEQMDSVSTDDFLDGMSNSAKDNLNHLMEVTLDEPDITEESEPMPQITIDVHNTGSDDIDSEELFNNNNNGKPKRKYNKRSAEDISHKDPTNIMPMGTMSNPVLDQLAKDVIDDLRARQHKINRFDNNSMEMIFDYMYSKF